MKVAPLALLVAAAPLLGACRGNFDNLPPPSADSMDGPIEPLPLPDLVCARHSFPLPSLDGAVDLAVTSRSSADTTTAYIAAWNDPADGSVSAARFDRTYAMIGMPRRIVERGATAIGGLESTPQRVWMVTSATPGAGPNPEQTLWSVSSDLSSVTSVLTEASGAGFEPIAVGSTASVMPIWVRGGFADNSIRLSYLQPAGTVGAFTTYGATDRVTHLSFADYTDHVHLGWRTADGKCYGSDVDFNAGPMVAGGGLITSECEALRVVSGPEPHDPLVAIWTNLRGEVFIKYDGASFPAGGEKFSFKLGSGRAPKISFDGTAYWVAWRDDQGVRFARVDMAGGATNVTLPGYLPAGDEAFELVQRDIDVDLVIRSKDSLSFFSLCSVKPDA